MRSSLLLLLLGLSCQDYRLWPDPDEKDLPQDSEVPQDTEGPSHPAGTLPVEALPTGDTSRPPCELKPRPSQPYTGSPSCTPMPEVSWELSLELEIHNEEGPFGSPVVISGSDGRTLIMAEGSDSGSHALVGYDGATGEQVFSHQVRWGDANGATAFKGSAPGSRDLYGTVNDTVGHLTLVNVDAGTTVETAASGRNWTTVTRDIEHDGAVEILTGTYSAELDGSLIETYTDVLFTMTPTVADTDGDGIDELYNAWGRQTVDGSTSIAWEGLSDTSVTYRYLYGGLVRHEGTVVFAGQDGHSHFVADLDGVPRWVHPPFDGDEVAESLGALALGDIDGDGEPELFARHEENVVARDLDGAALWQVESSDDRFWAEGSVAMADLDADGVYELIVWGSRGLMVLRGTDGAVLAHYEQAVTLAIVMPPIVADVDGDGSTEIVVTGSRADGDLYRQDRLFVFGPASGRWARTRPVWNQVAYDVTSVRDDGTVPAFPRANHETYNSWRAQPAHDGDHPDLEIEVIETCRDEDEGLFGVVSVHCVVHNRGSRDAPTGALVRLLTWEQDSGVGLQEVDSYAIQDPIPSMTSSEGVVFRVSTEEWATRQVVQVDGAHDDECDWVNDRVDVWEE